MRCVALCCIMLYVLYVLFCAFGYCPIPSCCVSSCDGDTQQVPLRLLYEQLALPVDRKIALRVTRATVILPVLVLWYLTLFGRRRTLIVVAFYGFCFVFCFRCHNRREDPPTRSSCSTCSSTRRRTDTVRPSTSPSASRPLPSRTSRRLLCWGRGGLASDRPASSTTAGRRHVLCTHVLP